MCLEKYFPHLQVPCSYLCSNNNNVLNLVKLHHVRLTAHKPWRLHHQYVQYHVHLRHAHKVANVAPYHRHHCSNDSYVRNHVKHLLAHLDVLSQFKAHHQYVSNLVILISVHLDVKNHNDSTFHQKR